MTSLLEGDQQLVARGTDIGDRVKALDTAVKAAQGRLDEALLVRGREVVRQASERLRLSADHTVVALGGATGSGKSSTFNALVGLDLASVGVRRPTTSWATACTWGVNGAAELLEWLGIPPRHQVVRDSLLDTGREAKDLDGLVLMDLPDHDSTEVSHHLEVERLVRLADLLVWVLDPQKYADAAIHDRFLKPLAAHKGVMMIVLNHIDEVREDRRAGMIADLRRLLDADGLDGIPLIAISAADGLGVDELRREIVRRVAEKATTRTRIATSVTEVASAISSAQGSARPPAFSESDRQSLRDSIATAAGVPQLVETVRVGTRRQVRRATRWPALAWTDTFAKDPFADLDLDPVTRAVAEGGAVGDQARPVRIDAEVRAVSDRLSEGLTRPWSAALRRAATSGVPEAEARLSRSIGAVDLGLDRAPGLAQALRALQWVLLLAAVAGGVWWAAVAGSAAGPPQVSGVPVPAVVLAAGVLFGWALALLGRVLARGAAERRAAMAEGRLRAAVRDVVDETVIAPIVAEVDAYRVTSESLQAALR